MSRRTSEANKAIAVAWERERKLVSEGMGTIIIKDFDRVVDYIKTRYTIIKMIGLVNFIHLKGNWR